MWILLERVCYSSILRKMSDSYCFHQVISVKDNDSLSSLLSVELKADLLLILSDVQGIYSGPPDLPESRLLDTFRPADVSNIEFGEKSRVGRGGMESKVKVRT